MEVHLRFLQLQSRTAENAADAGRFTPVDELAVGAARWLSWDEAMEHEITLGPFTLGATWTGAVPAGGDPGRRGHRAGHG